MNERELYFYELKTLKLSIFALCIGVAVIFNLLIASITSYFMWIPSLNNVQIGILILIVDLLITLICYDLIIKLFIDTHEDGER